MAAVDRRELAAIFVGGMFGGLARVAISELFPWKPTTFPWAMFAVNVVGAVLLGYFVTRLQDRLPASLYRRPLLGTGFCGAFTTFSTMQLELLEMIQHNEYLLAGLYAVGSIVCGYLAIYVSTVTVRRVRVIL